jgi:hypothetical protein
MGSTRGAEDDIDRGEIGERPKFATAIVVALAFFASLLELQHSCAFRPELLQQRDCLKFPLASLAKVTQRVNVLKPA